MSRILFVVNSDRSHLNPCIGPAQYLIKQGHTVAFHTFYNVSEQLKKAGINHCYSMKSESPPVITANRAKYFSENVKDKEWLKFSLKTLYLDRVPGQIEPLRSTIKEFKPDLIACDPKVYEGAILAESEKISWITLTSSLTSLSPEFIKTDLTETINWLKNERDNLFANYNINAKFRFSDCLSPHLNLSFCTDELLGSITLPEIRRIGPSLPLYDRGDECDFPWKKINDKFPIIYTWLGTQTYFQPEAMRTLFEAVKDKDVQMICSVSELLHSMILQNIPSNIILLQEVPQLSLLPATAVHISHGGASSVMESLSSGVPILVSPVYDDQAHQAYFIDKSGAGQRLDLNKTNPDDCWKAINNLIRSPKTKESMEKIQMSYKKRDGAFESARLIERML